jgi:hypothetical protein
MVPFKEKMARFLRELIRRPLSLVMAVGAGGMIVFSLALRIMGNWYYEPLNYIDTTTIAMIGVLLLRGLSRLWRDSDAQAASIALIGALSFIFCFEALFKLSFYAFPRRMAPPELRDFIIQVGIALTALAGFAFQKFRFSRASRIFAVIFVAGWVFWLAVGFPQLPAGGNFYPPLIDMRLSGVMIYAFNRLIKLALCAVYFFLYA